VHFKIIFAILGFAISGLLLLASLWIYQKNLRAEKIALTEIAEIEASSSEDKPDPGLSYYRRASELITADELASGRDLLLDLVRLYPDSAKHAEAKRVIGEVNMDLLLSKAPMPGKTEYIVQRGNSLAGISSSSKTTYDYIMRVNGLFSDRIHPGDKLTVFPLDFSIVVKTAEKTLTLMRKDRFFKEYPVDMVAFPPGVRAPFATKVTGKSAYLNEKRLRTTDAGYPNAPRWLTLSKNGFMVVPTGTKGQPKPEQLGDPEAALEEDLLYGVFISAQDMHEIYSVVTLSTPVSVTR